MRRVLVVMPATDAQERVDDSRCPTGHRAEEPAAPAEPA